MLEDHQGKTSHCPPLPLLSAGKPSRHGAPSTSGVAAQNNKDYLDQSLDEIKLLKYVNEHDPSDEHGILQLYDYFYYKVSDVA